MSITINPPPVIFQHQLARTADGTAAYVKTKVTMLTALEAGPPA